MSEPTTAVLEARDLSVEYRVGSRTLSALLHADLAVYANETVALVGESGSGKSTLAMSMMRARRGLRGELLYRGKSIGDLPERRLRSFRRDVQMVFQDPYSSLDPRLTVEQIVSEGLRAHRIGTVEERRRRVGELLEAVGLPDDARTRRPAQFSGGQRQRIAIARALSTEPQVVIADEPVSALDVSIQAQIVNLLQQTQRDRAIGYLIVSHDLPLVHHLAHRVVVLYLGRIVETGSVDDVVASPQHPYTASLLAAAPALDPASRRERIILQGAPPSPIARPSGCEFHPRCPIARPECARSAPPLQEIAPGRRVACFFPGELAGIDTTSAQVDRRPETTPQR